MSERPRLNTVPFFSPRIWNGMLPKDFGRLMGENRYRIDRSRWPMAFCAFAATGVPWAFNPLQRWFYGKRADELPLVSDPIFVIGHWRSGTTLLHELLTLDERFASPSTFECFNPLSFMLTEKWLQPLTGPLLPKRRPMDNMDMGWNVPQEDEFALMTMGLPTMYRRIAFPNEIPRHLDYLNMTGIPQPEIDRWKDGLGQFIKYLNYKHRRALVLKSPPHTGRISIIRSLYPDAKFIHMSRDPLKFIPSTLHLWRALDITNGFQKPRYESNADFVFMCFKRMYDGYFRDREVLAENQFATVQFEALTANPVGEMKRLYEQLELDHFADVEALIHERMNRTKDFKRNKYACDEALKQKIAENCSRYDDEFGYPREQAA